MRMTLGAIGRGRDTPETLLFENYWNRAAVLGRRLGITGFDAVIAEPSRRATVSERVIEEAERLERKSPPFAHRIVCDQRGRSLASDTFATQLAKLRDRGIADVCFLIGGPDGLSPAIRDSAQQQIAFGAQTWPHLLVRAMLAEQIYRALTILSGHPYHRG